MLVISALPDESIVFFFDKDHCPNGHYVVKRGGRWMDPWTARLVPHAQLEWSVPRSYLTPA